MDIVMVQCYEKEMITDTIIASLAYHVELCILSITLVVVDGTYSHTASAPKIWIDQIVKTVILRPIQL